MYGPEDVMTFAEAALAYAEDGGDTRFLVRITKELADMKLKDIKPKDIRDAARRAYPEAAPATQNRQGITPARAVMNYGHAQGWCPAIRVSTFKTDPPKKQAVEMDYMEKMRPHMPDRLFVLMLFLHVTGRRVGDAVSLTPAALTGNSVLIPKTKTGAAKTVIVPDQLADMMRSLEPRHGRLFGYKHRHSVYNTLRRACERAGLPYLGTHQPGRHSFATALHGARIGIKGIAEAGGWASIPLLGQTYIHDTDASEVAAGLMGKKMATSFGRD